MNILILTNAHLALAGLTETATTTIIVIERMNMVEIITKVAVQDIRITALTMAPGAVRRAVATAIRAGDSGHAYFGI